MLTFNKQCLYACGSGTIIHCWVRITAHFSHLFASPEVYKFILCSILYYQYFHPTPPNRLHNISYQATLFPRNLFHREICTTTSWLFLHCFSGSISCFLNPRFLLSLVYSTFSNSFPPKKVVEKVTVQGSWLSENILILYSNFSLAGYTILG